LVLASWIVCAGAYGCEKSSTPVNPSVGNISLTAPAPEGPADQAQLSTLRPTLTVRNGTSSEAGIRTYDFQVSAQADFSSTAVSATGVPEGQNGTTSYSLTQELAPSSRFYWRSRVVQGTSTSPWSPARSFNSQIVGFNRPGELYDPLVSGETIGTIVGSTAFVPGQGIRINNEASYVAYQLAQTLPSGELSVEVQGLAPNGPNHKLKIFSMSDGPGDLISSRYQFAVHYRGVNGNPDNAIAFKATWGSFGAILEPDFPRRADGVRLLNPSTGYLWRAIWNPSSLRVVVSDGGNTVYDLTIAAPNGTGPYAPSPHFAFLGATSGLFKSDAGSFPGAVYRNLWIGSGPRPAAIGSAVGTRTR
jgi:hypothetical protein